MATVRAKFDGRAFIPERPVDLPEGTVWDLEVTAPAADPKADHAVGYDLRDGFPVFRVRPGGRPITDEDVKRALEDED